MTIMAVVHLGQCNAKLCHTPVCLLLCFLDNRIISEGGGRWLHWLNDNTGLIFINIVVVNCGCQLD